MRTLHLFAGAGGGLLADLILGHTPIAAVEWDAYCCQVLRERAEEGWFHGLRVHEGDVRLFDPSEYKGRVDLIHAGFPCTDVSAAGRQAGVGEGTRSGLYREVLRIADALGQPTLFLENVAAILSNGLGTVLGDLAARGYDCRWTCLRASDCGAPHQRDRWWLVADAAVDRRQECRAWHEDGDPRAAWESQELGGRDAMDRADVADADIARSQGRYGGSVQERADQRLIRACGSCMADSEGVAEWPGLRAYEPCKVWRRRPCDCGCADDAADSTSGRQQGPGHVESAEGQAGFAVSPAWWESEPDVGRVAHGVASRVDRLKALGNGQVPLQAALAWRILTA